MHKRLFLPPFQSVILNTIVTNPTVAQLVEAGRSRVRFPMSLELFIDINFPAAL